MNRLILGIGAESTLRLTRPSKASKARPESAARLVLWKKPGSGHWLRFGEYTDVVASEVLLKVPSPPASTVVAET